MIRRISFLSIVGEIDCRFCSAWCGTVDSYSGIMPGFINRNGLIGTVMHLTTYYIVQSIRVNRNCIAVLIRTPRKLIDGSFEFLNNRFLWKTLRKKQIAIGFDNTYWSKNRSWYLGNDISSFWRILEVEIFYEILLSLKFTSAQNVYRKMFWNCINEKMWISQHA